MTTETSVQLSLPSDLAQAMEAAAWADGTTADEWMADAAQQKLQRRDLDRRWQALTTSLQAHARRHGFRPEDVDKAIAEHRRGQ